MEVAVNSCVLAAVLLVGITFRHLLGIRRRIKKVIESSTSYIAYAKVVPGRSNSAEVNVVILSDSKSGENPDN
jgi:hypothetical protein